MTTKEAPWDHRNLNDTVKTAKARFIGKMVHVEGGGMWNEGVLLDVSNKREASVRTEKRGIQGIAPVERIELIA